MTVLRKILKILNQSKALQRIHKKGHAYRLEMQLQN